MSIIKYLVKVEHKDKGVGYSVKKALKNSQKQEHSPIIDARIIGVPSSTSTTIMVSLDDVVATSLIGQAIDTSGQLPTNGNLKPKYTIELYKDDIAIEPEIQNTTEEIEKKQQKTQFTERQKQITTPLEGMLAYFETTRYVPQQVFDNPEDRDFARMIFTGLKENSFLSYFNHVTEREMTEKEINKTLREELLSEDELSELKTRFDDARREAEYVVSMKKDPNVPESLKEPIISMVLEKGTIEIIRDYIEATKEQQKLRVAKEDIADNKKRYDSFKEHLELLDEVGHEFPILFNHEDGALDIYTPFKPEDTSNHLLSELTDELSRMFEGSKPKILEHDYVAFRIEGATDYSEGIKRMVSNVPCSLRLSGVKEIIPYVLGKE